MSNIRLFLKKKIVESESISLDNERLHYLKRVMRKKNGEMISIFNGKEQWDARLNLTESIIKPERKTRTLGFKPDIYLYFSLLKKKQMNYLIEKVCEIGVKKIIPIKTEYSEIFNLNYDRLEKIIIEAVEQSEGIFVPEIEKLTSLQNVLEDWNSQRKIFFCDEDKKVKEYQSFLLKKKISLPFLLDLLEVGHQKINLTLNLWKLIK